MRPVYVVDSLQTLLVPEQRNLSVEAVRANQSDARAWSPAPSRRIIVVLRPINANLEIINEPQNDGNEYGPKWRGRESESSVVGKRRLHRDRRFHAAVRRSDCGVSWRDAAAARVGSWLRRWNDSTPASSSGRQCNRS